MKKSNIHQLFKPDASDVFPKPPGGGDGGGTMEERIARLESDVEHIKTDISDIKTDIRDMRKEISDFRVDFTAELHKGINKMMAFTTTIVIASMAIMAAIFAYIVK